MSDLFPPTVTEEVALMKGALSTAIEMRKAQAEFFRTRDRSWLERSKAMERDFDKRVRNLVAKGVLPHDLAQD